MTTPSNDELKALALAALAASQPWTAEYDSNTGPGDEGFSEFWQVASAKVSNPDDAAHIAAANPQRVIALVDELAEAKADLRQERINRENDLKSIAAYRGEYGGMQVRVTIAEARTAALTSALAEARKALIEASAVLRGVVLTDDDDGPNSEDQSALDNVRSRVEAALAHIDALTAGEG